MAQISSLFVTRLYRARLSEFGPKIDPNELEMSCLTIANDDEAGQTWCEENGYPGYTSYASLTDLPWRFPIFADLVLALDKHVAAFSEDLEFDLDDRRLVLEDLWINVLPEGGMHASHIHPHSAISGTTYVSMPDGTSALKLEDPRSGRMMAAPARRKAAREELRTFVYVAPKVGDVLLWESWLRHEVPMNLGPKTTGSASVSTTVGDDYGTAFAQADMNRPALPTSFLGAVLIILLAIFLYDVMGAIVKHLSGRYSTQQLTVFRNLFGLVPSLTILLTAKSWAEAGRPIIIRQWPLAVLRGALGVMAQMCFYLSLIYMDLATATTLVFAGPLFITALSVPILRHRIGAMRWAAVLVGFSGVLWVLNPGTNAISWYAALPVCAALGYASTAVTSKLFDGSVPSALINLYYTVTALIASTLLVLATGGFDSIAQATDWVWLIGMGLAGGMAAFCMTTANRLADPSSLSPFQYFGIPSSFVLGWLFFSETPFDALIPGVFLIVGGGLMIIWRERAQPRMVG